MSSLCCAIATPDRSLPCHRCAILGISSLFHANASEAKPCRCESLRCTTFPSQITSALFSAIPSPRCSSPFLRVAMICSAFALPVCASQCRCVAVGCATLPLHSSSPHSLRRASPRQASHLLCLSLPHDAMPLLRFAMLCLCHASSCTAIARQIESQPCRCQAVNRTASANPGRQCHALALRLSPHRRCR